MTPESYRIVELERREAAAYKRADALEERLRAVELELAGERGRRKGETYVSAFPQAQWWHLPASAGIVAAALLVSLWLLHLL